MFRKWIGRIHLASFIGTLVVAVVVCVYYNVLHPEHDGAVELWGILLLSIPFGILCLTSIPTKYMKIDFEDSFDNKKIPHTISKVLIVLIAIPLFPILLIMGIVAAIFAALSRPNKRNFKPLIDKGFVYRHQNKTHTLQKDNIRIEISENLEEYRISFDKGETFTRVEESHLGLPHERDELKFQLETYRNAHPVDRQRGDATPPLAYFVDFLDAHLP